MEKNTSKFNMIVTFFICAIAVFAVAASVSSLFAVSGFESEDESSVLLDYSVGWKGSSGFTLSFSGIMNGSFEFTQTEPLVVTKHVLDDEKGKFLYIHSRNLIIDLYADGKPLHITAEDGSHADISGFDNYIIVGIPDSDKDYSLEMKIYATELEQNRFIGKMLIGEESAVIKNLLWDNVMPLIFGVILIVLGVGLIVFGLSTRKKVESYLSSAYYGIFLVFISAGNIFDSSWAHIVFGNVVFTEMSLRIFLSAALPAFIAFIDAFFVTEHVYPVKVIEILSAVIFPVLIVLNSTGVVSFMDIGTYYLIFVILCGLVIFEELFVFMRKTRGAKSLRRQRDYISVFIFLGCCIMDIISYIRVSVSNDDLFFTRIGLLVMSTFMIMAWFGEIIGMVKLGVQAGRIGKIAFTDANTGIGNVAAFKSEFDELESKKLTYSYIGIVQFDVNNLKVINDSKGHEAGDLLIKTAADIINDSFGKIGNCYRTGGDEFVALITDDHAPIVCEEAIFRFNRLIDKFNNDENKPFDLRIAYGIAYYQNDKTTNTTLKQIHKIADERMYENKKMLKARYARTAEEAIIR